MALAIVPGLVAMMYQARQKIWGRSVWKRMLICAVVVLVSAMVAAVIAAIFTTTKAM